MRLPRPVRSLVEQFERLPGIGPKSAQRLALYMLHVPDPVIEEFRSSLADLKAKTVLCEQCHFLDEESPCVLCTDTTRDSSVICVVESPLDVLAFEQSETYHGLYHILHGVIAPLENIGPDQLFLRDLVKRLGSVDAKPESLPVRELILATNPTMEGEGTALYIEKMVRDAGFGPEKIRISRIGHGLPIGADIEYADGVTLARAIEGRRDV